MNVTWIYSHHCEQCEKFESHGVTTLLADTFFPLTDVWFESRRIDLVGSVDPTDDVPAPVLTKNGDGRVQPIAVHTAPTKDLRRKLGSDVQTPTLLLDHEDTVEEVDPIAEIGKATFDNLGNEVNMAARGLVSKTFDFYVRHVVDAHRMDKIVMRQQPDPKRASMKRLKPPRRHGEFRPYDWIDAFTRARQAQY